MEITRRIIQEMLFEAIQPDQLVSVAAKMGMVPGDLKDVVERIDPTGNRFKYATWIRR
jgi:hypothetical protein